MNSRITITLIALLLAACGGDDPQSAAPAAQEAVVSESDRINAWFAEKNEERLMYSPLELTTLNCKDMYDQIDDFSQEGIREFLA